MCVDLPLDKKTVENQDWATGPLGLRAAGPSRAVGRGPMGLRAAGPLGRWAVAGRGPRAAGPLGRGPAFGKTQFSTMIYNRGREERRAKGALAP